jgi:hypothetical protein
MHTVPRSPHQSLLTYLIYVTGIAHSRLISIYDPPQRDVDTILYSRAYFDFLKEWQHTLREVDPDMVLDKHELTVFAITFAKLLLQIEFRQQTNRIT